MKAERRHELKENSLAKNLENAPAFFQVYGSRLLLGLILALLAYLLVHNHYVNKADRAKKSSEDLGTALYMLNQLRNLPLGASPEAIAHSRKQCVSGIEDAVSDALSKSDNPKLRAAALVGAGRHEFSALDLSSPARLDHPA